MKFLSVDELKGFVGKLVRMRYAYEWRDFSDYYDVICSIVEINEKHGYIYIGHPYDLKKKEMFAGQAGIRYDQDDYEIFPTCELDLLLWQNEYEKFHNEVIAEKGYDFCEEDIEKITLYKI